MSKTNIPEPQKRILWGKAAGRCQFKGCNKPLFQDSLTKYEYNLSYHGHIVADSPDGPRGDEELSPLLAKDIDNIMLLCDIHHRLIDQNLDDYPVETLLKDKKEHEERIERVTNILPEQESNVVLYGANIGEQSSPLNKTKAYDALIKNGFYPAESDPIELGLKNSVTDDSDTFFWEMEKKNLKGLYEGSIQRKLKDGNINHLSIFGIAPQPLLIYFGTLLSDIPSAELFQLHRTPPNWVWQENIYDDETVLIPSGKKGKKIALAVSLSQKIEENKILTAMEDDSIPIWKIQIKEPHSEYLKCKSQLEAFRIKYKKALSEIKYLNGSNTEIHLFPAAPVSVAIEMGRARFPKVDLPMVLYDYNKKKGGFQKALEIE